MKRSPRNTAKQWAQSAMGLDKRKTKGFEGWKVTGGARGGTRRSSYKAGPVLSTVHGHLR